MSSVVFTQFWEAIGYVFALDGVIFRIVAGNPHGLALSLWIVLFAGVSQAIAQSIILFINQVKPVRFVLSLLLNVVLFAAGCLCLVLSTWLITLVPWSVKLSFSTLVIVLGLGYVPLLFSFLGALPYLGLPLLSVLNIWHLLAMVVGFASVTGLRLSGAFSYVVVGWIVLQCLQHTIGRPIARFSQWLANRVAGVELATSRHELLAAVRDRMENAADEWKEELQERMTNAEQGDWVGALTGEDEFDSGALPGSTADLASARQQAATRAKNARLNSALVTAAGLVAIALLTLFILFSLRPVREWWFGWQDSLPRFLQFLVDLVWISIIAIVVAGLLAPLETLGWWAGWYDDEVDTTTNAGELAEPIKNPHQIKRYIVYLDGIGKSTHEYLPDVEEFLDSLVPALPDDVALIRGIMPYSVVNNPLDEDRPLAFLWKAADQARGSNPMALLGLLVNIRNVLIVGVSADQRYGPLYNQGIAQVVYNGLIKNGYRPGEGVSITLIGYSGGAQMACACAPFLKKALSAPIDVISLGGVISGNCNILKLEHLYHLVGQKDVVEAIGPVMFPGRWKLFALSYWNRAKRRGKISIIDLGAVGHQVPGGLLDPDLVLDDGRSALQQTIDLINAILSGSVLLTEDLTSVKLSNYELYRQKAFNRPTSYPVRQTISSALYQPIGTWMGRLVLPKLEDRKYVQGVWFEVYHADAEHQHLVGEIVKLRWRMSPLMHRLAATVRQDIHFSAEASYTSKHGGLVHPDRLNHWLNVDPLESLAGALPGDDMVVMLNEPVEVQSRTLYISSQPVQISGRFYGLVQFVAPIPDSDQFRVVHFNRASRRFDGPEEVVRVPEVVLAEAYGSLPSTTRDIEQSPYNETGWYIYGAKDSHGLFVVQAWGPRSLFRLQPEEVIFDQKAIWNYLRKRTWAEITAQKGKIASVLCANTKDDTSDAIQAGLNSWRAGVTEQSPQGPCALLLHVYGGIGGQRKEPAAASPIFFGHFAFGVGQVVWEPLAGEPRFDLRYYQVYTHNTDGIVAGTLHWSRYMGDRQFGWMGTRPVCDILIKHNAFTEDYDFNGVHQSALDIMELHLQVMTARYRTGDGTGGTYVGPVNNCAQDSNHAFFASLRLIEQSIYKNADWLRVWAAHNPEQAKRFQELFKLGKELKAYLQPLGGPTSAWEDNEFNLGTTLEDSPVRNLITGLGSWRTMLPRLASDTVARVFLKHGATLWVLRTNQVGGVDPNIEPIAPMTL